MIVIGPDDFRIKNCDFSASGPNCLVYVIEAVQNMKISVFHEVPRADGFFVTFLRFLYGPHRIFSEKSQFLTRFWTLARGDSAKNVFTFDDFHRSGWFSVQKSRFFSFRPESISRFRTVFWRVPRDDSRKEASIFCDFPRSGAFFAQNRRFFCFRYESSLSRCRKQITEQQNAGSPPPTPNPILEAIAYFCTTADPIFLLPPTSIAPCKSIV